VEPGDLLDQGVDLLVLGLHFTFLLLTDRRGKAEGQEDMTVE
jgi:hypothetical protein